MPRISKHAFSSSPVRIPGLPLLLLLLLLPALPAPTPLMAQLSGSAGLLEGRVLSLPDSQPVAQAMVQVMAAVGSGRSPDEDPRQSSELRSDQDGRFSLSLPVGRYDVAVEAFGFADGRRSDVLISDGQTTRITITLQVTPFRLDEIVIVPGTFGMLRTQPLSGQLLTREELEVLPHPGNDIIRAVAQVPGVSTFDYSAKPLVRGARAVEVLTILDGLELLEPYHLKHWDGSLSIVDVETVSEVSLTTGGFTAEYGDKSAGVLAMRSADPPLGRPRTTVGLDFMSSILKSEGTFHEGKGTWLASARRGFLAFVFELTQMAPDEELKPSYYDVFSRVQYEVRPGHSVSAQILHAGDENYGEEKDSTVYRSRYGNSYAWLGWEAEFSRDLSARTVASVGLVTRDRNGSDYWRPGDPPVLRVEDENNTAILGLRQDWQLWRSARMILKWGVDLRRGATDYDYFRASFSYVPNLSDPTGPDWWPRHDTVKVATSRSGFTAGAYLANRMRLTEALTVEAGLRYDRQSHTGEQQISPRINAAFQLTPTTALRGAWGLYHQSQAVHELWASDADTVFHPAQKAEHRVLELEQRFENGMSLRVEAYQRLLSDALPEFRTIDRNMGALWEEDPEGRLLVHPERGRAEGLELFLKSPGGGRFTWSGSYALSRVEEVVSGEWVPRPFDQRHAVNLQAAFRPTPDWSIAVGWIYHSPWPFTEIHYRVEETVWGQPVVIPFAQALNQGRLIPYKRIDFRASRKFRVGSSDLLLYADIFNVLNHENAMDSEHSAAFVDGRLVTERTIYPQLGIMPSLGLRWAF